MLLLTLAPHHHRCLVDGGPLAGTGCALPGDVQGEDITLPELPIQYADYALWQRQWLEGRRVRERGDRAQPVGAAVGVLARAVGRSAATAGTAHRPSPSTGTDLPRGPLYLYLAAQRSAALRQLSRQEGVTLFMTLLAAFAVLLSRYSGQEDIVVGTPIANRTRAEVEGVIGFFVNTLALRTGPLRESQRARIAEAGARGGVGGLCPSGSAL